MKTMTVTLSHCRNPDIAGYHIPPADPGRPVRVPCADLRHAVRLCGMFIARNHLGSGNWNGGQIHADGKQIARVSFNGRLWEPGNYPTKEILP